MNKDQKFQQFRDGSFFGLKTFDEADSKRKSVLAQFKAAKDKESKVKVRCRTSGLFDVLIYRPLPKAAEAKTETK